MTYENWQEPRFIWPFLSYALLLLVWSFSKLFSQAIIQKGLLLITGLVLMAFSLSRYGFWPKWFWDSLYQDRSEWYADHGFEKYAFFELAKTQEWFFDKHTLHRIEPTLGLIEVADYHKLPNDEYWEKKSVQMRALKEKQPIQVVIYNQDQQERMHKLPGDLILEKGPYKAKRLRLEQADN
jgi:hypothetical protein